MNNKEQGPEPGSGAAVRPNILLVDDDPVNLNLIRAMLIEEGYEVQSAENGRQCLELVDAVHTHLVLMDVEMPLMDGIQACRQMKRDAACQAVPVIFVTAHTDDETLQAAFEAGGSDYVRKPVSRIELLARVRTALFQRMAFERRTEEEKLKSVLETAGGVCHELNQPLQYVLGAVQLMMMDIAFDDPLYERMKSVVARVEQMGEITRKLTEITRYRTRKYVGDRVIIDLDRSIS